MTDTHLEIASQLPNGSWLMPNAASLVEATAKALLLPPATVRQHMRVLREANEIAVGGRGITARDMTLNDAASLFCAIAGSASVGESADTVKTLRNLGAAKVIQQRWRGSHSGEPDLGAYLALPNANNVIQDTAGLFKFFCEEKDFQDQLSRRVAGPRGELYAKIEIEYPISFASITLGLRGSASQTWTYGSRRELGLRYIRKCSEREIRTMTADFQKVALPNLSR